MGLSLSLLSWTRFEVVKAKIFGLTEAKAALVKSISFGEKDIKMALRSLSFKRSNSATKRESNDQPANGALERSLSFKNWEQEGNKLEATVASKNSAMDDVRPVPISLNSAVKKGAALDMKSPGTLHGYSSPRPLCELEAAATTVQKIYKSYRTRRNLADCAVVVEEFWWKALDFASLERSSVSFFDVEKTETAVSRWSRARTRAARVGKGLSKDEKAQKLALQHWLEAIDPRHRYGHNLHIYYDIWFASESTEPFFYWLDVGDGREVNLEKCPRSKLHSQCIKYLGPNERESYEVIVEDGKLVYKQNQTFVNTTEGSKWIFVLSTSRALYVGQKRKGTFQHSSFLSGAATTAAGRLIAEEGNLKAIWPYSGHYLPTEENFKEFISFLQDNNVDLTNVKRCSVDDDEYPSITKNDSVPAAEIPKVAEVVEAAIEANKVEELQKEAAKADHVIIANTMDKAAAFEILGRRMSRKWNSPTGARIGCVRDYPAELQHKALEQVNLSPRVLTSPMGSKIPIPSPRPSPNMRLSPRLQYMGFPTPTVSLTLPKPKRR